MGWPMPDAGANDPAGDGSRRDADRPVTARRSFSSWSQTVAEPCHGRARLGPVPWIFFCEIAEPDPDRCHIDGSAVDEVALVIPGGHRPVLAQSAEGALDGVALLVGRRVESGRAAALAAAAKPAADLVGGLGNGGLDAASSQAGADRLAGVCLIGKDPAGSGPWPPRPAAGDRETVQERDEGEGVVALPGAGHPGQRPATSIGEQVNLGGQPAPGPAQRLPLLRPGRLGPRGRRILVIRFSPLCGPGRSAWPRPASPGRCRAPAHAGPRPRADAPGPPSRPPRPSTPSPLPHRTLWGARTHAGPLNWAFYPRPLCSSVLSICSWSGCSAGWRSSRGATLRRTWRSWCCGTRLPSCAVSSSARSQTGPTVL